MEMVVGPTDEDTKGRPRERQYQGNMSTFEMTYDMTENRRYWKMMVKTGLQRFDGV